MGIPGSLCPWKEAQFGELPLATREDIQSCGREQFSAWGGGLGSTSPSSYPTSSSFNRLHQLRAQARGPGWEEGGRGR